VKLHVHSSNNNRSTNPNTSIRTMFLLLLSWKSHCKSSRSSSDECGTVPGSCRLSDQVNQTYLQVCLQAAIVYIHCRHLVLISRNQILILPSHRGQDGAQQMLLLLFALCNSCQRLYTVVVFATNTQTARSRIQRQDLMHHSQALLPLDLNYTSR